jgi:uncharacterized lipoprotein YmbA
VGLGPVKLPDYLFRSSMAIRKSPNEVGYLEDALWAERLDTACQRVLADNLATLLPSGIVHRSAWRAEEIACELHVTLDQFDVDAKGQAVLAARWRILSPAGATTLDVGQSRLSKQCLAPAADPQAAAAALSDLLADLSTQLSNVIKAKTASP